MPPAGQTWIRRRLHLLRRVPKEPSSLSLLRYHARSSRLSKFVLSATRHVWSYVPYVPVRKPKKEVACWYRRIRTFQEMLCSVVDAEVMDVRFVMIEDGCLTTTPKGGGVKIKIVNGLYRQNGVQSIVRISAQLMMRKLPSFNENRRRAVFFCSTSQN